MSQVNEPTTQVPYEFLVLLSDGLSTSRHFFFLMV
jgi:hypothetical protein